MFANLIESTSHQQDLARKGRFFLATLIGYALVVAIAGLMSIHAYDAHVENQDLEFIGLVPPIIDEQPAPETKSASPKASNKTEKPSKEAERTMAVDRASNPTMVPKDVSAIKSAVPEIPPGPFKIGTQNSEAIFTGSPTGDPDGTGNNGTGKIDRMNVSLPPAMKPVEQTKPTVLYKSTLLNGDAMSLPKPPYPPMAKSVGVQGVVSVQVMIDESGKIVSARASSGSPLLRPAAVQAAYRARFNPTLLNGVPVKVSGVISYNFTLQ